MDETRIIKEAQKGSVAAFNQLVMAYQGTAYNVAYRVSGNGDAAADACQDAFLKAYQAIKQYRGGSFKSWLLRIVTNACYDELRYRKRRPQSSLDELTEENESSALLQSEKSPGPEEHSQQTELVQAIQDCLDDLPEEQRVATVLCDVEGYDYSEIADIMSTSLGTVKSRISRARSKIRDCLQSSRELLPADYRL